MAKLNQAMQDLMRYNAAITPQKRSTFSKSHSHATTLDSGYLVPVMWDRVLPGDEKKIRFSGLARMATPIHPTMDDAYLDCWAFYIPDRLWWTHAKEFYGENLDASFNPDGEYTMPYIEADQYLFSDDEIQSLNDYFGFPMKHVDRISAILDGEGSQRASVGLHRSYQLIWNEFFRNSSVQPALQLNTGDNVTDEELEVIMKLRKVCKMPDMFTSLLLEPQAGDDVMLPLGALAPVVTGIDNEWSSHEYPLKFKELYGFDFGVDNGFYIDAGGYARISDIPPSESMGEGNIIPAVPNNLYADLSAAPSASINDLRAAITVQQLLEIDALAGKRYQNIIKTHFGVFTPDATLQRPELLGASRTRIGMRQVLQTSETVDGVSPQGNAAGVSVTNVNNEWICNKGFTEPGFIMVLCAIRPLHSYSQGVNPLIRKLDRYDHYWPVFDNLGNQPVYKGEVYFSPYEDSQFIDFQNAFKDVFGYKEAWQEYRMMDNRVSGKFRPDCSGTLASWNYSSNFTDFPILNSEFVEEDPSLIERTIAVQNEPQFLLDCYFDYLDTKNMGVHSTPGLYRL